MAETARRITTGTAWVITTRWAARLISFISLLVLARLLLPEDFGLVAVASAYVAIIEGLSAFDVNKALIQLRDEARDLYDSAWTLSLVRGVLSAVVMIASASLVAGYMEDQRLEPIIYVLSLQPLVRGALNPKLVYFEKNLIFSKQAYLVLAQSVFGFSVTVTIAVIYQVYWAIIFGTVAATILHTLLSYVVIPYLPRLSLSRLREIFSFSGWMSLSTIISTLALRLDNFVVGRVLGISETGVYYMTREIGRLPTEELLSPLHQVLFPSFSEFSQDLPQLKRVVFETIGITASIGLPVSVGFALVANDIVPLVLGSTWDSIIPYLQILVPVFGLQAIFSTGIPVVMALGATRSLFTNSLIYSCVRLPTFILATIAYGLIGSIWALVGAGIFFCFLQYRLLKVCLGIRLHQVAPAVLRPTIATVAMFLAVLAINHLAGDAIRAVSPVFSIATEVTVGGLTYCFVHYVIWRLSDRPAGIERRLIQFFEERK